MNSFENKICRLCLKKCNGNFDSFQDTTKENLDRLLVNMDLDISEDCVSCKKCSEMLQKCFEFKSICVNTEEKLVAFIKSRNINGTNMREVYLENLQNHSNLLKIDEICRFCMNPVTNFFGLDEIEEYFSDILQKILPEVTLNITSNPVSCSNCFNSIKSCFMFLKHLQNVEEHIRAYCEGDSEIKREKVELCNVVQYVLKKEKILTGCEDKETLFAEQGLVETYSSERTGTKKSIEEQRVIENVAICEPNEAISTDGNYCLESIKKENTDQGCIKTEEIEIKIEEEIVERNVDRKEEKPKQLQCSYCKFKNSSKRKFTTHLRRVHHIRLLSCDRCGYKTHYEDSLKKHKVVHSDDNAKFKCPECKKVFHSRRNIENHFLNKHENLCDLVTSTIHSCNICTYKSICKSSLSEHINAKHSQSNEYQCNYCLRTFLRRDSLKLHVSSNHLNIKPYICKGCKKTFKQKVHLDCHIVSHHQEDLGLMKTVNKIFKCDQCAYKCVQKTVMIKHLKTHVKN